MHTTRATLVVDCADHIGEGPVWDPVGQRILWSDHHSGIIHQAESDGLGGWRETRKWTLGRPLAAAVPRADGSLLVVGTADVVVLDASGRCTPFTRVEADPRMRLNDVKCDPCGRAWVSAFFSDLSPCPALYRIDPNGIVTVHPAEARLGNGLAWSPDGATMYFADSISRTVDAFDYDCRRGTITNRRTVVTLAHGQGLPNGLCVDKDGFVWIAVTGGGEVRRYTSDGEWVGRATIPVPAATSCAFGGPQGADLFITSRTGRLPEFAIAAGVAPESMDNNGPGAGGLFVCQPGPTGAPAVAFAG